jgi:hypothetical protein
MELKIEDLQDMKLKIKDLHDSLSKKALKRMKQQRGFSDENYSLLVAFDFSETKEGAQFWARIVSEYPKRFLSKSRSLPNTGGVSAKTGCVSEGILAKMDVVDEEIVTKDSIVESVVSSFRERSEVGTRKYGTTLDRNDLSMKDWIQHLHEELMDAILYLEKIKKTM